MQGAPEKSGEQKKKVAKKNGSLQELGRGAPNGPEGRKIAASREAPMVDVTPLREILHNCSLLGLVILFQLRGQPSLVNGYAAAA